MFPPGKGNPFIGFPFFFIYMNSRARTFSAKPNIIGVRAANERQSLSSPIVPTRKEAPFVYQTKGASFQLNPPFRVGEIIFDGEIPHGDEIRLDGGWVDLISSVKQISSEQSEDFIALCAISLKNEQSCSIIQLDKLEFGGGVVS